MEGLSQSPHQREARWGQPRLWSRQNLKKALYHRRPSCWPPTQPGAAVARGGGLQRVQKVSDR